MELEGKIILELPEQSGVSRAGNQWKKKEWVLETINSNFPRKVKFHCFGERADNLKFEIGKSYIVSFDLESREFNGRWYTDVSVYNMREIGNQPIADNSQIGGYPGIAASAGFQQAPATTPFSEADGSTDDLPF